MNKYDNPKSKCSMCGSDKIFRYHRAHNGEQIFKCSGCKVQFMNPQLSDEYLSDYYSNYIRDESYKEQKTEKSLIYCLSLIEKFRPGRGSILDIGSGNGYLLKAANDRGWNPTGHEINNHSATILGKRLNMNILSGEITGHKFDDKFDAITMIHVLEHVKQPLEHIRFINSVLNNSGILFLALPNIQSRSALFKFALEKLKIKRKEIAGYYDVQHHLWYFTPFTIRRLLERCGFEVIKIYSNGHTAKIGRSGLYNYFDEKIFSKLFWHSSMEVIARKSG